VITLPLLSDADRVVLREMLRELEDRDSRARERCYHRDFEEQEGCRDRIRALRHALLMGDM
jgi:hypothetical protein